MGINYKASWTDVRAAVPNDARWVFVLLDCGFLTEARLVKELPTLDWRGHSRNSTKRFFALRGVTHWADSLNGCVEVGAQWEQLLGDDYKNLPNCYSITPSHALRFHKDIYHKPRTV